MKTKSLMPEPLLEGVPIGSEEWFTRQRDVIRSRPLTRRTYELWYGKMLADAASVAAGGGRILEIGSGAGFARTIDPSIITSDIVPGNSDMVVDARHLPFDDGSLRAIMLTHVFHHVPDVTSFLNEALRTLVNGGVITMIEVAHTPFSRFLFGKLHPEDYDSSVTGWALNPDRPCGGANQALSWVVFRRDRERFQKEFPGLSLECIELLPWLGYLLSGGVTRRNLVPNAMVGPIAALENALSVANPLFALHWHIRVRKVA
jgi:SAM-dependent methyltransferase